MAHGEWDILRTLVSCIDDGRNDIFVHIDAKVKDIPDLTAEKAGLHVLEDRVDVRWGDLSVVDAEGCMRAIGWKDGCLYDWAAEDYERLAESEALFARKFNSRDMGFVRKIAELSE